MNQPLVSVIVSTFNSSPFLDACLRSIKEQSYENIELIVVDNNSRDNTKEVAHRYTKKVFNYGPERSAQRNYGVRMSKGSLLLIIDSDMELSPGVVNTCVIEYIKSGFKSIVIPEESFGEGLWAQCKKLERSFYIGVAWMEAARFFERVTFQEMKGYDEQNTGTEDYDLPQRIVFKYGDKVVGRVDDLIYHNEQRISLVKTCKKKFYYAKKMYLYKSNAANIGNFKLQSNPINRYKIFLSDPIKLLSNPIIGIGMLFMKSCEYASGGVGYIVGNWGKNEK
jgi:glycosyltransferase involved in cell wall biosynthesis